MTDESQEQGTTRREFAARSVMAGASLLIVDPSLVRGSEANSRLMRS